MEQIGRTGGTSGPDCAVVFIQLMFIKNIILEHQPKQKLLGIPHGLTLLKTLPQENKTNYTVLEENVNFVILYIDCVI